jgi:hypothetical protein
MHEPQKVYILEIKKLDTLTILSQFDESKGLINLEPLCDYIGEKAMVTHFVKENDCTRLDYEHVRTITKVDKDEHGLWFLEYN